MLTGNCGKGNCVKVSAKVLQVDSPHSYQWLKIKGSPRGQEGMAGSDFKEELRVERLVTVKFPKP